MRVMLIVAAKDLTAFQAGKPVNFFTVNGHAQSLTVQIILDEDEEIEFSEKAEGGVTGKVQYVCLKKKQG